MALGGMDYFSRLDEAKQQQYRDVYNKHRESGMGATDAMNAAQQHIMSLETPEAPETVPSANPTRTLMQNPFNTRRLLGTEVQSLFGTNRAPSQVTDQDRANAAWTPSQKTGLQFFEGLTDPTEISKFRNAYNNARDQGISPQEAAEQGKQAVEGAYQTLRDAANRNVLMDQAREDVNSVMGVDAYNKMDTADKDAVLNGWRDGGIDGIYAALKAMGSQQKYGIGEGWNPDAQTSVEEPDNITAEAALPAAEPEEELTPAQRTERAFENRIAELLEERERGVSAERNQEIQRSLDVLYSMYDNYKAKQERENNPIYNMPEKPDTSEIDSRIEELYRQLGQAEADIRDSGATRQLTARRNAISSEIEKLQAERERLQAQYEEDRKNAEQTLMDQMQMRTFGIMDNQTRDIVRGTGWNALNSIAAGWHGVAGNIATTLAYGADKVEKALGLSNAVSGYLKRGANYWRSMQGLAEKEANRGKETALQGVMYVLGKLTDPETAASVADDARTATYWVQNNIVSEPFKNIGNILPGTFIDLMSGGANTAYNISRVGAEAAAAWGGRGLVQQLAGGVQAAMSNAGFGATFAGEFFGDAAEKIDNGEDITPTDAIWMMAGAYVNALIEYGGDDVASGFQALLRDDAEKGLKGFLSAEKGETIEELTQLFTGRVFENVSYALQHNGEAKYKLYSDEPGEALICLAEYWDTTWHTLISTGIMTGTHYTAGALRNAIVDINSGRTLSQEQIDCVREFTESMEALQEQEAQHNQFAESVTDPNSAYEQAAEAEAAEENIRNTEEAAETGEEIQNSEETEAEAESEETAEPARQMSRAEIAAATMREYEDQHLIETAEAMALRPEYFSKDTQAAIRGEMARRGFAMPEPAQSFERTAQEIAPETTNATTEGEQTEETPANATTEEERAAEAAEEAAVEAEEEIRNSEEAAEAEEEIQNSGEAQEEEPRRGNVTAYTPEEWRSIRQEALERMTGEKTEDNRAAIEALEELRGTVTEEPNPEPRPEETAVETRAEAQRAEEQEGTAEAEVSEEETDRALENAGTTENDTVEPDNRPDVPLPQERRGEAAEGQRIQAEEQEGPEAQEAQEESADRALEDGGTAENGEEAPGGTPDVPRPEEATGEAREVRTEQTEEQETRPSQEEQTEQIEQRNERVEAESEEETETAAREYGFKFGATNGREDTGVHLVSGGRRISQSQRQELQILDTYAKSRGLSVEWYDSLPHNANGMYQGGNVIRLSAHAENPLSGVFGHELYHMIRQYSSKNAEQIEKLFDRWAAAHDFDTGARIEDIIDNYRRHGVELGRTDFDARAAAKEEVIANSMAYLWSDPEVARQMYAQDRTLLQRVLDWAREVQQTIREMLRRYADKAPEARFLEKADSDLSEVMRVVDEALRDMQALDDVKKTAGAVHGNDAATVKYERKVRAATSQREITHAARALAEDVLKATGNEVNDANVTRMMYAAEAVHMGVLPYAAMKDNMLKYENSAGANRALQMLGNYVQLVKDQRNVDEFMALLSGEEQSGEKYSLKDDITGPYVVIDAEQEQFEGLTPNQTIDLAKRIIKNKYLKQVLGEDNTDAYINSKVPGEYAHPHVWLDNDTKIVKGRASTELAELMDASEYLVSTGRNLKHHTEVPSWDYYTVRFRVGNGNYFATVNVKNFGKGKRSLHDITRIEKASDFGQQGLSLYRSRAKSEIESSFGNILPKEETHVKEYFSLPEPAPADIFADSEIALDESLPNNRKEIGTLMVSMDTERRQLRDEVKQFESEALSEELLNRMTSKDKETVNQALQEYKELEEQAGIAEKQRRAKELDREISKLYKQSDAIRVKELRDQIEKSGLSQAEYFRKAAVKEFGYTPYFVDAGYILPNGKMLNFSGEKGKHFGMRGQDHRAIGTIFEGVATQARAMNSFINMGNIRIMDESPGVDISVNAKLTPEQRTQLRKHIRERIGKDGYFVDFTLPDGSTLASMEYGSNTRADKILADIDYVQETGEAPRQSDVAAFHTMYSLPEADRQRDEEYQRAVESGDEKTQRRMVRDAAVAAGAVTDEKGKPIKLYHGTTHHGFTTFRFDVPLTYTTTSEGVASGYASHGRVRGTSERYIADDGTDATLIRNARNVMNSEYERLTEEKFQDIYKNKIIPEMEKIREKLKPVNEMADYAVPDEISTEFWDVATIFDDMVEYAEDYMDPERREDYARANRMLDRQIGYHEELQAVGQYRHDHRAEIEAAGGMKYFDLLLGDYDVSDALIDIDYNYAPMMAAGDKFVSKTGSVMTREDLQQQIERFKGQGVYEGYGFLGENPLIVDAERAFWTAVKAPMIGDGYYTPDDIAFWARKNGYTSAVIKNVLDPSTVNEYGDDYIFFEKNQFKSDEAVTYDDDGNPIPLSERFNDERTDIRYSINEQDPVDAGRERWEMMEADSGGGKTAIDLLNSIRLIQENRKTHSNGEWKQDIKRIAAEMTRETGTGSLTQKQVEKRLTQILSDIDENVGGRGSNDSIGQALSEIRGLLTEIMSENAYSETYREVLNALKGGFFLTDGMKQELGGAAELRDFRRALSGIARVYSNEFTDKGRTRNADLRSIWMEKLNSIDPGAFSADANEQEMATILMDYIERYRDMSTYNDDQTRQYIAEKALTTLAEYYAAAQEGPDTRTAKMRQALAQQTARVEQLESQLKESMAQITALEADGQSKAELRTQLKELQARQDQTMKELREADKDREKLLAQLNTQDNRAAYLRNTINQLKKNQSKLINLAAKDARQQAMRQARERAQDTKARQNIKKAEQKMRRMLEKPSATSYVPYDKVRQLLNMVEAIQTAQTDKQRHATESWLRAVREMREDPRYANGGFDENFVKQMEAAADILSEHENQGVGALKGTELQYVANTVTQALYLIENSTKLIGRQKNNDALLEGRSFTDTINAQPGTAASGVKKAAQDMVLEHLSPERMFNELAGHREDNAVHRVGQMLVEGQRDANMAKMQMTRPFEALMTGKNAKLYRKFAGRGATLIDTGVKTVKGKSLKITQDERVALYLHSLNDQNLDGMKNGLTIPDHDLLMKGKVKEAWARADRVYLKKSDIQRITADMTEYERAWAKAWQELQAISTPMLNETSMALNGYRKFQVENYFPIRRDKNYLASDFESLQLDNRVGNQGFLHERKNASNPMMLEGLYSVVNRTINGTSLYVGLAIPVSNFNKVFNAKLPDYEDSPKAALRRVFGDKYYEYIERMMTDLQGASQKTDPSIMDKLRGKAAGAALGANATVIVKQAASYPTAAAEIGWKPLLQALTSNRKFDEKLVEKYTSAYWERTSANIQAMNANTQAGPMDRTSNILGAGITGMDKATVRKIWIACEFATEEQNRDLTRGTDEYYQEVARKYERCLERTQPEYGVMQRPHILRSNNQMTKTITMYKTQSMQNFNILYDAVADYMAQRRYLKADNTAENRAELQRAKTNLARAASSQVISAVVLALMTAAGKALLHKVEPYQDEKGEVTGQSVAAQLSKDMISSMAGMMVGGSELFDLIVGIAEGKAPYDIEAGSVSMVNDLYQSAYRLGNAAASIGDSSLTTEQKLQKGEKAAQTFLESVSAIYGVPLKNLDNIRKSAMAYVDDILSGRGIEGMTTGDVTLTKAAKYMGQALQKGDKDTYVRLYNRLIRQGKTQSQINSAMKTWMKTGDARVQQAADAIDSGDLDTYNRLINELTADGFGMANAVNVVENVRKAAAQSEDTEAENEITGTLSYDQIMESQEHGKDSVYTYAQLNAMLEQGNVTAAKKVQSALFKSKGTTGVKSALTNYWKPRYQEAYQARNRTELNRITRLMKQMGYSDSSINKWKSVDSSGGNSSYKKKSSSGFGGSSFGSSFGGSRKKSSKRSGFGSGGFGG